MELLTIPQAAEQLGMKRQRVFILVQEGRIKAMRVGRGWIIKQADLDRFNAKPRRNGGRPRKVT